MPGARRVIHVITLPVVIVLALAEAPGARRLIMILLAVVVIAIAPAERPGARRRAVAAEALVVILKVRMVIVLPETPGAWHILMFDH